MVNVWIKPRTAIVGLAVLFALIVATQVGNSEPDRIVINLDPSAECRNVIFRAGGSKWYLTSPPESWRDLNKIEGEFTPTDEGTASFLTDEGDSVLFKESVDGFVEAACAL